MFQLHKITLTDFRSYRGTHEFEFPVTHGLYFLAGKNKLNPSLGANGAGKSTFLDAITWVLFGRTTRGLKANEVLSWGATSAEVVLELTAGDRRASIKRSQKPNGLYLDDKAVDQEELQKYLRLNFDSFKYSVLNPQFTSSFFALEAQKKLTLFSDIMELDFWLDKSDEASKLATAVREQIDKLVATINHSNGQVATITDDIEELKIAVVEYEDTRAAKVKIIEKEAITVYDEIKGSDKRREKYVKLKSTMLSNLKNMMANLEDLTNTRDTKLRLIEVMGRKLEELNKERDQIIEYCSHVEMGTGQCLSCKQGLTPEYAQCLKRQAEHSINNLDVKKIQVTSIKVDAVQDIAVLRLKISRLDNDIVELRSTMSNIDIKITKLQAKRNSVNQRLDDLAVKLDEVEMGENPHKVMLESKEEKLRQLNKQLIETTDKRDQLEAKYEATKFWIKGFKRIRLFIIEQAFNTLEVEVNNTLAQLGMPDWQITFDVERENKSGGITKGFVVFIKGPANAEPVKWESWSGGETQRLQLAGDLGLANLIMQRAGLNNTIEFFDEPSTHLSPEGMMDLANMLHERAIEEGKCIWIVDHTSITNFGEFKAVITAEKGKNGSSITVV